MSNKMTKLKIRLRWIAVVIFLFVSVCSAKGMPGSMIQGIAWWLHIIILPSIAGILAPHSKARISLLTNTLFTISFWYYWCHSVEDAGMVVIDFFKEVYPGIILDTVLALVIGVMIGYFLDRKKYQAHKEQINNE